jgi:hypothetical protein
MPLRNAVLAAALLTLSAASRAEEPLTPEKLIEECGAAAQNEAAALARAYGPQIVKQAPERSKAYSLTLTRDGRDETLTMIARSDLTTFFEGSALFTDKCRVGATSPRAWALIGYLEARRTLVSDIKRTEMVRKGRSYLRPDAPQVAESPEERCAGETRHRALVDALAFKKLAEPTAAAAEPLTGKGVLAVARNGLYCLP